jgi:NAD(P)-dependent dehydrogenase (short-subunit alcohol dehydrogenase family)
MDDKGKLAGKVALITGGASGIGRKIGERFAREGACVAVADISEEDLDEVKQELGDACITIAMDVTCEADVEKAVRETVDTYGKLDIAVNSAGTGGLGLLVDYMEEQWDNELAVCLKGTFLCMKHEGRRMIDQGEGGTIVNMASLNAGQPAEGMSAYCAAKAGVEMLTRVGAMEMGPYRVRVNCISPGLIDTPLTSVIFQTPGICEKYLENIPLGRSGVTDDVAAAALFLASDDASWITAENLYVDGGSRTKSYPRLMKIMSELCSED